jgi:hypothetical protein
MRRKGIFGTMRRWKASLAPSKLKACIIIILKPESMLNGLSLNILKCSIIVFDDMQKLAIKYLLTSPVSITLAIKLQHNSYDLPSTKSDPASESRDPEHDAQAAYLALLHAWLSQIIGDRPRLNNNIQENFTIRLNHASTPTNYFT